MDDVELISVLQRLPLWMIWTCRCVRHTVPSPPLSCCVSGWTTGTGLTWRTSQASSWSTFSSWVPWDRQVGEDSCFSLLCFASRLACSLSQHGPCHHCWTVSSSFEALSGVWGFGFSVWDFLELQGFSPSALVLSPPSSVNISSQHISWKQMFFSFAPHGWKTSVQI